MVQNLNKAEFLDKVFNYEANREWKYEGTEPCVIDFYADWCGPCKMVAPVLEKLSEEYHGAVKFYKVDTEKEPELASTFGIRSIPTLLFVPAKAKPQIAMGALPRDQIVSAISDIMSVPVPIRN